MHTNALVHEKSPYLRQHAHNPVDWMPWGDEAFQKAKKEDKPIFLSVGYSTCHWCHVMAHESFEDEDVAALLNRDFISIKIDREERPDVDRIYMLFVQASTGSGGWPMSVWLTPDRKPFFGGTYFPPDTRYGRPGFADLLRHLANAWKTERARIEESSESVLGQLLTLTSGPAADPNLDPAAFGSAYAPFRRSYDKTWGGFGGAPKFPRPVVLNYLFRYFYLAKEDEARDMACHTLQAMARGGMHDQLGGGFHRYSVDGRWFVPHFEKMLYDQGQLAVSYLEAFQITRTTDFASVAEDILRYVLRDMTDPGGGFYSAEDADSPDPENPSHSGEGAFYIWRAKDIRSLLSADDSAALICHLGVEDNGNVEEDPHNEFGGRNILFQARSEEECASRLHLNADEFTNALREGKAKLFAKRNERPRPHLDNKILTSWNCLMISAFVKGFEVLGQQDYLVAAERAMAFILSALRGGSETEILRRFCDGEAAIGGMLEDYALVAQACLELFEATGKADYLVGAHAFGEKTLAFADEANGGFYSTTADASDLVVRMKEDYDGAEPSGSSVATDVLLRLAHLTNNERFRAAAEKSLHTSIPRTKLQPTAAPLMLSAFGRWTTAAQQVVVRCSAMNEQVEAVLSRYRREFRPYTAIFAIGDADAEQLAGIAPFLASLERKGAMTVYRCHDFTCELPEVID